MFGFVMIKLLHFCDAGLSQLCDAENICLQAFME